MGEGKLIEIARLMGNKGAGETTLELNRRKVRDQLAEAHDASLIYMW